MPRQEMSETLVRLAEMSPEEVKNLSDGDKLRLIAAWFDIQDQGNNREVQVDLMRIADKVDGLDAFLSQPDRGSLSGQDLTMDTLRDPMTRELGPRDSFYFILGKSFDHTRNHRAAFWWCLVWMVVLAFAKTSVLFIGFLGLIALLNLILLYATLGSLRELVFDGASKGYPIPIRIADTLKAERPKT